jgi:acylphosphatase
MTERLRRHLWISGRVQGVWFRESARAEADARAVTGWVRNLPDGRVEVALEGDRAAVEAVEAWCRQGPRQARVVSVDARDEAPLGPTGPADFEVR